MTKYNLLMVYK